MNPTYHNPDNLPSPGEGWRFFIEDEPREEGDQFWSGGVWFPVNLKCAKEPCTSYRTRRPLPVAVAQTEAGMPRTDVAKFTLESAAKEGLRTDREVVDAFFARTLERELATARRELEAVRIAFAEASHQAGPEVVHLRRQLEEAQRERDELKRRLGEGPARVQELQRANSTLLTHAEALARALEEVQEEAHAPTSVSEEYDATPTATERLRRTASLSAAALAAYRAHQSSQQEENA